MPLAPPKLTQTAEALATAATTLLHNLASLDLTMFQVEYGLTLKLHYHLAEDGT